MGQPPPDHRHLGPVQFDVSGYAGVSYDDNINGSQYAPESDIISRLGVNVNLDWQATANSELQLGTGIGYLDYQTYTANNGLEVSPNSALTYAVSLDDVILTLFDQLSYSKEVRTQAALANVTTLPQLDNNVGARVEWDPGHWTFLASYSHDNDVSTHANDYLNRASEYLYARAGWRFAEATQAGLEASDALTRYQTFSLNNNQNLSIGGYVNWKVLPSLTFTLRGGPAFYEPESGSIAGNAAQNTYYFNLEANQQITSYLSHRLSVQRSLQAGINLGTGYEQELDVNYSISWALTQWITVGVQASYVDGQQSLGLPNNLVSSPQISVLQNENYAQYGGGLQASWQCTQHLSANLGFNHWQRESNLADRSYSDNSVYFQLNYTF